MTRRQRERSQSLVRLYLASAMDWIPACGEDEGVWSRCTQRGARGRRHSLMSASMWVAVDVPRRWLLGLVSTWLVPNVLASALLVPFVMASALLVLHVLASALLVLNVLASALLVLNVLASALLEPFVMASAWLVLIVVASACSAVCDERWVRWSVRSTMSFPSLWWS
jgi:hypothetical protein